MTLKEMALEGLHDKVHAIVTALALKKESNILILGSGEGALESWLLSQGYRNITSVDLFTKNKMREHVRFLKLDLNDKEFANKIDGRFDLIACIEIVEHLHDTSAFMENLVQLLAKDGTIMVSTPNIHSRIARIDALLTGYPSLFIVDPGIGDHVSPIYSNILAHHCAQHQLRIVERIPFGNMWTYLGAYRKKSLRSWLYVLALGSLTILLSPLMIVNRKLKKGVISIFLIHKR